MGLAIIDDVDDVELPAPTGAGRPCVCAGD
jgi:hypothetical protein